MPNEFGIKSCDCLIKRALPLWNWDRLSYLLGDETADEEPSTSKKPFDVFRRIFPDGKVVRTVASEDAFDWSGVQYSRSVFQKSVGGR
jgi:hypothetical protein